MELTQNELKDKSVFFIVPGVYEYVYGTSASLSQSMLSSDFYIWEELRPGHRKMICIYYFEVFF